MNQWKSIFKEEFTAQDRINAYKKLKKYFDSVPNLKDTILELGNSGDKDAVQLKKILDKMKLWY